MKTKLVSDENGLAQDREAIRKKEEVQRMQKHEWDKFEAGCRAADVKLGQWRWDRNVTNER